MRLTFALVLSLLSLLALAADKGPGTQFRKFLSRSQSVTPIKLDDSNIDDFTAASREYTAVVLFTALPAQFGCEPCKLFQPEYSVLAQSWMKGDKNGDTKVLFGYIDFSDGKKSFQKVCGHLKSRKSKDLPSRTQLGLQTAPVVMLYPPTTGPHAKADPSPLRYDFAQG